MNSLEQAKKKLNTDEINKITNLSNIFNISFDEALLVMIEFNGDYDASYKKLESNTYLFAVSENDRLKQNLIDYNIIPPQVGFNCEPLNYSNCKMKNMLFKKIKENNKIFNSIFNNIEYMNYDNYGNRLN
tara:strand:- start:547 stop:936 length:390 start_codon:yes stop_codon:yes gene_type:complete